MSKTDFESVREGRHYLRNQLSVVAAFVYIANDSDEDNPVVSELWDRAQKIAEVLAGGSGKTKADQVLALSEVKGLFEEAAEPFSGEVKKVLNELAESAEALAAYASGRDFESHQKDKEEARAKWLEEHPEYAALLALQEAGADGENSEQVQEFNFDSVAEAQDSDDPDNWK
jgi:hypothetical protein